MASTILAIAVGESVAASLVGNYSANAPVMLMLGAFKFSLNTLAPQTIERTTEANWAVLPVLGQLDALQYTGPGRDEISLPGVLYPDAFGTAATLDQLRDMQAQGIAYRLLDSTGTSRGRWVILGIREARGSFKPSGGAQKIEFTVDLAKYADV